MNKKRRYQSYDPLQKKINKFIKVKVMERWRCINSNYDSIDFENLTVKFWIKTSEVIIIKGWV